MTSKQRAYLRGLANPESALITIGKSGVTPETVMMADQALTARELVKLSVLDNAPEPVEEIARTVSERTRSELIQTIGRKFVLYRVNNKDKKIFLPR